MPRLAAPLALACSLFAAPPVQGAGKDFKSLYEAGVALHKDLEFERALETFRAARVTPHDTEQEVALALFEGILLFELGKQAEAEMCFRAALVLRPQAALPVKVAPRIEFLFESIRSRVRPARPAVLPSDASAPRPADGLAQQPAGYSVRMEDDAFARPPHDDAPRRVRKLPIALMVVGSALVVGGGAVTGYTVFNDGGFTNRTQAQLGVVIGLFAGGGAFLLSGVLAQVLPEIGGAAVAVAPTRSGVAVAASFKLP